MSDLEFFEYKDQKICLCKILEFTNLTTNKNLTQEILKHQPGDKGYYSEFNEESIALEVPFRSCAIGAPVFFNFKIQLPGRKVQLEGSGKVLDIDLKNEDETPLVRAEIKLAQYDKDVWELILFEKQKRMDYIKELFESMKGS